VLNVGLAALGGLALALGLASRRLRDWPVSEPLLALILGVLLGPAVLGTLELPPGEEVGILRTASELVLAISLMAVALRFPLDAVREHLGAIALLTAVAMLGMVLVSTALAFLALGAPLVAAAVLGTVIAPTDPVLASSVVEGEPAQHDLPARLRVLLSMESGANDVLAFPLVVVAVAAATDGVGGGTVHAGYAVLVGIVLGVPIGYGAGLLVSAADRRHELEHSAFLVLTVALTVFALGVVSLVRGEGILAVFAAGLAYNHSISRKERKEEWEVQEAVNRFLVLPVFTLLGVSLPWAGWADLGWRGPVLVVAVLALRRLPLLLALAHPLRLDRPGSVFLGWFGPVGVAALFYLAYAALEGAVDATLWSAGTLVIVASTVAHGVTAAPARQRYARVSGPGR
jgi:sodium/hydrogen antiporter